MFKSNLQLWFIFRIDSNFLLYRPIFNDEIFISSSIYSFKVNQGDSRKKCEICSKLTTKMIERRSAVCKLWTCLNVFLVFSLFTLNIQMLAGILQHLKWNWLQITTINQFFFIKNLALWQHLIFKMKKNTHP